MIDIKIKKQFKGLNDFFLLDFEFGIESGSLIAIYGESGSGKTSLLRMISGLLIPDNGSLIVEEEVWYDSRQKINLAIQKREIGFVFQDFALFPNMTIKQNISYGIPKNENSEWLNELLHIVNLEDLKDRYPDTLSGGQKQR